MLFFLLFLEVLLLILRVQTKEAQMRLTVAFRGIALFTLVLLSLLRVITWGFRYYALAITLLLLSAQSLQKLLRKNGSIQARERIRPTFQAVLICALYCIVALPAMVFPEYAPLPTTGEYSVKTFVERYTDQSRVDMFEQQGARTMTVEFWYPDANGHYPLVMFSHGALATRVSNETLFQELASHGYVVCSIDHMGHCLYTTNQNGKLVLIARDFLYELRSENARQHKRRSLALYQKWMDTRVSDIDFVLDTVVEQTRANPSQGVYAQVDTQKIGVVGHSLGGSAALGIGRQRSDITAVVALESPYLCDILSVKNDAFVFTPEEYPLPVLNVYSDSAWPNLSEWPQYAQNVRLLTSDAKNVYNLHIKGTGHLSLTDLVLFSPILTRVLNGHSTSLSAEACLTRLNEVCLSFLDCYLKGTGTFRAQ